MAPVGIMKMPPFGRIQIPSCAVEIMKIMVAAGPERTAGPGRGARNVGGGWERRGRRPAGGDLGGPPIRADSSLLTCPA